MITRDDFFEEFNGHGNAYSSFMVIGVSVDDLLKALNKINPDMWVGSGYVSESGRAIYFEICKELPELMGEISAELQCVGFADIGAWYGEAFFFAYNCGEDYDDFTAEWQDHQPELVSDVNDEEWLWNAFVTVTDNSSGETFFTGDGAIDYESLDKWRELVREHRKECQYDS